LLVSVLLTELRPKIQKGVYLLFIFTLLLYLGVHTKGYNALWGNERQYCLYWLKHVPGYKSVMFHLAGTYLREGEYAQAQRIYKEALENTSSDEEIYINLGLMDEQEGNLTGAVDHYKAALIFQPHSALAYNNLGIVYLKREEIAQAQECFERALALNRFLIEPRLNLASLYEKEGKSLEAQMLLEENLTIDPHEERSLLSLIRISLARGEKAKAVDLARRFLAKSRNPQELTFLGSLFAQYRFLNMAFSFYFKALRIDPSSKNAFLEVGKLYGNLGQLQRAILFWQEGLRYHPTEKGFGELITEAQRLLQQK